MASGNPSGYRSDRRCFEECIIDEAKSHHWNHRHAPPANKQTTKKRRGKMSPTNHRHSINHPPPPWANGAWEPRQLRVARIFPPSRLIPTANRHGAADTRTKRPADCMLECSTDRHVFFYRQNESRVAIPLSPCVFYRRTPHRL